MNVSTAWNCFFSIVYCSIFSGSRARGSSYCANPKSFTVSLHQSSCKVDVFDLISYGLIDVYHWFFQFTQQV